MRVRTFRTIRRIRPDRYGNLMRSVILCMVAGAFGFALGPRSSEADPVPARSEGEQLAQMVCSACHIVAIHQERRPILKEPAPNFCEIANRPDITTSRLAHFVTHTHWDEKASTVTMPDPMLNPDQARAVSRYILGLRGHCDFANPIP